MIVRHLKNRIYWFGMLLMLGEMLFSCKQHTDEPLKKYQLKVVEAKGYEVPKDNRASPKIIPVGNPKIAPVEKYKVVAVPANVKPAGNPKVVVAGVSKVCTPGQGSFSLPQIVPVIESPIVAGLPKVIPAKEIYSIDPNPQNFSSFNKLQGLQYTNIQSIIEDKSGNLWFGTKGGGVAKYDGQNFTNFTQNEGLGNNNVSCLFEDENGNLWFGTWGGGVTKYDGQTFTRFTAKEGLSSDYVFSIMGDRSGNLWIGTWQGGVSKYDASADAGKTFAHFTTKEGLSFNSILSIIEDRSGNLWMGTDGGGVSKYDGKTFTHFTTKEGLSHNIVTCITEDRNGNLWFGTQGGGISKYDGQSLSAGQAGFTHFTQKEGLRNNFVLSIIEDKDGNLWFSNWGGGVTKFDASDDAGQRFTYFPVLEGLRNANVQSILEDKSGNLWFGTGGDGISKYSGQGLKHFTQKDGLTYPIRGIVEDQSGNIWIGTYGGGILKYDANLGQEQNHPTGQAGFIQFIEKDPGYSALVTSLLADKSGNIWFGTWGGGITKYSTSGVARQFFTHFTEKEGLSINRVTSIAEDKSGSLWIGTDFGGVSKYDGKTFTHFSTKEGLSHNVVSCIAEDKDGNLWFGTLGGGVTRYAASGDTASNASNDAASNDVIKNFTHFTAKEGLSNYVLSILTDHAGNLWFGTLGDGVAKYNGQNFTYFTEKEGLGNNTVRSIIEDKSGNLLFSTDLGLSKLTQAKQAEMTEKIRLGTINESDAFFTNYPGVNAGQTVFEDKNGAVWVGADDRLTVFHPLELRADTVALNLQLTHVALFNENIAWAALAHKKDTVITLGNGVKMKDFRLDSLSKWYNIPQGLRLAYNNNFVTFNYTAITLQSPGMVKYQHQLEGLEDKWSALNTNSEATYSNLSPGTYIFKAKARNRHGIWSKELRYTFTICPPWWLTWWAYIFYVALFGGSLFALYRFLLRQRLQQAESLRLRELDDIKTKLYTNITHEFRTPLTVILGMAHQVLDHPKEHFKEGLKMIIRNGQNLLTLVNQMLDLSKLESGKLTLHNRRADIVSFLEYIAESFHSLAENKGVQIHFIPEADQLIMDFDELRLQQIVSNLITNAIKFTPGGGHIYISGSTKNGKFILKIKDTGIGIVETDLPYIFDRFYQSDGSHTRNGEGTGIGLALTRELVKLMEGTIVVKSTKGKGAEFEVTLPAWHGSDDGVKTKELSPLSVNINKEVPVPIDDSSPGSLATQVLMDNNSPSENPRILIADDHEDVRAYLASCLKNNYAVEIAKNGQECVDLAFNNTPDLIVLDVMMPFKDGFEVCKTLKTDERTSHIPIIMLTAKADMDSKLEGLEQGADDYLTKPFHKKELLLRIRNLLELRRQLQQYYRSSLEAGLSGEQPTNLKNTPADNQNQSIPLASSLENAFVIKVRKTIEGHLEDPQFDVEKLCRLLALSHSQVHRKLSALTGLSTTFFIRYVRLVKAKDLLLHSGFSIRAIALDCGFNDPAYFTRVFKQEFGVTPQAWREQNST